MKKASDKKWLLWSLVGFAGILLATAVVLFYQLKAPAVTTTTRPSASPKVAQLPPVQQQQTEAVCTDSFTITELVCTGITVSPTSTSVTGGATRTLTAQVASGSGTYTHAWTITSSRTALGTLSSATANPTIWTAPATLTDSQTWTITDTITDTSTTPQTATCATTFTFGGLASCFDTCDDDLDCEDEMRCMSVSGTNRCVNPSCPNDADCTCPGASPSPSPSVSPSPTPLTQASPSSSPIARVDQPELPEAGVSAPAVLGVSVGILMVLLGLLF